MAAPGNRVAVEPGIYFLAGGALPAPQDLPAIAVLNKKGTAEKQLRPGDESALDSRDGYDLGHDRGHDHGRDRGHDHPSRGPNASGGRVRPTSGVRATSSTHAPRAILGVRYPPVDFASRGVQQHREAYDRPLRCAAGMPCHRREPPADRLE